MDARAMVTPGIQIISPLDEPIRPVQAYTRQESYEMKQSFAAAAHPLSESDLPLSPAGYETPFASNRGSSYFPTQNEDGQTLRATLDRLDASTPAGDENTTPIAPSFFYPSMNKWRVAAACTTIAADGLNDGAIGALLPYMETYYHVGYAVASTIFISNAAGFIVIAFLNDAIHAKLGRAKTLMLSEIVMTLGYVVLVCTPPFPAVILAYFLLGLGFALNLALTNVFCANLARAEVILGAAHGAYGIGGLVAPLVATSMVSQGMVWSRYFLILIGVRMINLVFTGWANWNYEAEPTSKFTASLERIATAQREEGEPSGAKLFMQVLSNKVTLLGALFIFAYQGAEVSISGWFISYLIKDRNGDPSKVGYTSSGFFGGITVGRLVLVYFAPRIGIKRYVYILLVIATGLQLMAWLVPSIVGDAVAVALLGVVYGPIYPCCQTLFSRLLPSRLHVSSIGFIASAGSSGGAIFPFVTGLLAQAVGPVSLNPVCLVLYAVMGACWVLLPAMKRLKT